MMMLLSSCLVRDKEAVLIRKQNETLRELNNSYEEDNDYLKKKLYESLRRNQSQDRLLDTMIKEYKELVKLLEMYKA
jgi:hypothetical protein